MGCKGEIKQTHNYSQTEIAYPKDPCRNSLTIRTIFVYRNFDDLVYKWNWGLRNLISDHIAYELTLTATVAEKIMRMLNTQENKEYHLQHLLHLTTSLNLFWKSESCLSLSKSKVDNTDVTFVPKTWRWWLVHSQLFDNELFIKHRVVSERDQQFSGQFKYKMMFCKHRRHNLEVCTQKPLRFLTYRSARTKLDCIPMCTFAITSFPQDKILKQT